MEEGSILMRIVAEEAERDEEGEVIDDKRDGAKEVVFGER